MNIFDRIASFIATVQMNYMVFDRQTARKLPISISHKMRFNNLHRGSVTINAPIKRSMVRIGFDGSLMPTGTPIGKLVIGSEGHITFNGDAWIGEGVSIFINGNCEFGKNFSLNKYSCISCSNHITFDDDVTIGWNAVVRDTDGHHTYGADGIEKERSRTVTIGKHVWIGAFAHVLRASIADECILGWGAMLFKSCCQPHSLLGGVPAKIIQTDITWEL